jgi:CheY-like chemotaxis protein
MKAFLNDTVTLLEHTLPSGVRISTALEPKPLYAKIDNAQMQMAISAIVTNAMEAIRSTGRIRVSCDRRRIETLETGQWGRLPPGDYLVMTIVDDGAGMDRKTLIRIFEPFFTTKFQGRGLGMAAVHGIIENHGGCVTVSSESGAGTEVNIYLPPAAPPEAPRPQRPLATSRDGCTILLIEDEEMVIEVNEAILLRLGYEVICARNGREAREILSADEPHIDLILLDIKLPDMDGAAIYPVARHHRPDAKIVICSGYALDGPTQALVDQGADGFIHKPFSLGVISDTLDRLLS